MKQAIIAFSTFIFPLYLAAQNVGIGTNTPTAGFQVENRSVLFQSPFSLPANPWFPPATNGTVLMWYPDKAHFRVGRFQGVAGQMNNIGVNSFAAGYTTMSSGNSSMALGEGTTASGQASTAMGRGTVASELAATALGDWTLASGYASTAMGTFTKAKSSFSLVIGIYNDSTDNNNERLFEIGNGSSDADRRNAMTVMRNGRVGIGTTNPGSLLHVNGTLQVQDGSQATNRVLTSDANGLASWKDLPASNSVWTASGIDIYNINSGNVGVGTTTPANKLHILHGASGFAGVHPKGMTLESNQNTYFNILTNDISESAIIFGTASNPSGTSVHFNNSSLREGLEFRTGTNNSRRMVITKTGSVGIGTGEPASPLHVKGSAGEAIRLQSEDPFLSFYDNTGAYSGYLWANKKFGNDLRMGTPAASNMPIVLAPNDNVAFTAATSGNVGIGTITPVARLEVVAGPSASATKVVIANKGGFGPAALEFVSDYGLGSQWRPGYIASNDNGSFTGKLEFFTNGSGSGNLYGAVKGLEVRNGATLTATGSVGSFSDARLKNNIEPFTDGLNVIEQINPVQFQYNADAPFATTDKQVGIVAQELEKVAPYMVHQTVEGNVKDMRWVDNQAYVFLLINAVKQLTAKDEAYQNRLEDLEKTVQELTQHNLQQQREMDELKRTVRKKSNK
jgi:hypothetical protein